jgi:peptide/nickel transport system substrate-binding protein
MSAGIAAVRRAGWRRGSRARKALPKCAVIGLTLLVTGCGRVPGGDPATEDGSTVTYAMAPGGLATYPFPFMGSGQVSDDSVFNLNDFQYLLYRPLYWFGTGVQPYMNEEMSLAYPATFQGHQVIIRLKPNLQWSDGEPVDARDVVFWLNMMQAMGADDVYYSRSGLPSDVTDVRAPGADVVTMDITTPSFSETWFADNELSEITPMPMAWDRTAAGPSDCATNIVSCRAVFNYLTAQASRNPSTFASSPVWSVVDGPWKIHSLTSLGQLTLDFNRRYWGPVAAHHISRFIELPFTSEQAEYDVLQDPAGSQRIDVGYLPTVDAPPPSGTAVGTNPPTLSDYVLTPVYGWQLSYFPYNFENDTGQGAIFRQLYFRQAFQQLVDEEGVIDGPMHGYGKLTIGPVADYPVTSYLSRRVLEHGDQWQLNIHAAGQILVAHGWKVVPGGTDTCIRPGASSGECGSGIPAGTPLSFSMIYAAGIDYIESSARELASNAAVAGIRIALTAQALNTVTGTAFNPADHTWQLAEWGGWTYSPDYLPTGDMLFESGSPDNAGQYDNPANNRLISATLGARTPGQFYAAMYTWEDYLAGQLPVVYEPTAATLIESIKGLDIGPQNSLFTITPEEWHFAR